MKRLLLTAILFALISGSAASAWPGEKAIVAQRREAAGHAAAALLRSFVPPRRAVRLAHAPFEPTNAWAGGAPAAKFAMREAFWRTRAPLDSVAAFLKSHPPHGLADQPTASGPDYRLLEFASGQTRYIEVTLLRRAGRTFIRAQADVVWLYPRSPREKVPAATMEIDIKTGKVSRHVTDPARVSPIVRWFDALPISPPGIAIHCPASLGARLLLVFRSANGTRLASASAPTLGRAGICNGIGFSIHDRWQQPLVDAARGRSFVYRLAKLLGLKLSRQ